MTSQSTMFNIGSDKLDGFDAFWDIFPRDPMRGNRKSGKARCKVIWVRDKIAQHKSRAMASIKDDIKNIAKGAYKKYPNSPDTMETFPGIKPYLNQGMWDRDVAPDKPKPGPQAVVVEQHAPMTPEEKARRLPEFRRMAKMGRANHD